MFLKTLSTMLRLLCTLYILALALAATPCCISREYESELGIIGSNYGNRHFNGFEGISTISIDSYNQMASVDTHVVFNGSMFHTVIILDHNNKREYLVMNGGCSVFELTTPMRSPCIPANATFLRETIYGYGSNSLIANVWEYTDPINGAFKRVSVTKDTCIPLITTQFREHAPVAGGQAQELVFIHSNFRSGIKNRRVFNLPKSCENKPVQKLPNNMLPI